MAPALLNTLLADPLSVVAEELTMLGFDERVMARIQVRTVGLTRTLLLPPAPPPSPKPPPMVASASAPPPPSPPPPSPFPPPRVEVTVTRLVKPETIQYVAPVAVLAPQAVASPPSPPPPPPERIRPVVRLRKFEDDPVAGITFGSAPVGSQLPIVSIPEAGIPWPTAAAPTGFIKSRVYLKQTAFEEWWTEGQFIKAQAGPYSATDNQATIHGFGYLPRSAITVYGWIAREPHGGGMINRAVEKSGNYPYRIFYDAVDPLGNRAIQAIREIYVYNPCVSASVLPAGSGYICAGLSVRGSEPVCATCTVGVCDRSDIACDPCVCVDTQEEEKKVVVDVYVPPKDFIKPSIVIVPGSSANGFSVNGIRARDSSGAEFMYEAGE